MVRRLPVVQNADADPERPVWHWPLIAAGLVASSWAPFVLLLARLGVAALLAAFALAAFASGVIVGRFGAPARPRHAALGGPVAAFGIVFLALLSGATVAESVAAFAVLALAGGGMAYLGGRVGARLRPDMARPRPLA